MRYLSLSSALFLLMLAGSCATTKPNHTDAANKKSSFTTGVTETNFSFKSNGLSNPTKILYQVSAHCNGSNCVPEEARLSFYINPGPNTLFLNERSLSIHAGEKNYEWQGHSWTHIQNSPPVVGLIKSVTLKIDEIKQVAEAQDVSGNLAGQNFEWSYKNRQPLRMIVSKMKSTKPIKD